MATAITKKPTVGVSGLGAPVRYSSGSQTRRMKATWKTPKALVNENSNARAEGLEITWTLDLSGTKNDPNVVKSTGNERLTTSAINLDNLTVGSKTYTRASFYPNTKRLLKSVSVSVVPTNSKGKGNVVAKQTRTFGIPKAPTISKPTFNDQNGTVSATITTDAGTGYKERYDTRYKVTVYDSRTKKSKDIYDTSSTSTSINVSYDVRDYQSMAWGDYVKITITAKARGYAGKSESAKRVFYVSYPAKTTITSVDVSRSDANGKATVKISNTKDEHHPIDQVRLEYLANVEYSKAAQIPGDAAWVSTDVVDDAECKSLAMPVEDLIPERGKYTWLRVKSYHASEIVLSRYSNYVRVDDLFTPAATATDDAIKILSATAGANGTSIVVHLGWNASGTDDSTGTELSWADEADAWKSTSEPNTYEFSWSDGAVTSGGVTYRDSATITIKGLDEGKKYYIRARRYLDGDVTTYSEYSVIESDIASETPSYVGARFAGSVANGEPLQVYWSFNGNGLQKEWQIVSPTIGYGYTEVTGATGDPSTQGWYEKSGSTYIQSEDTEVDEDKTYYSLQSYGAIIASGEGTICSTQISSERLNSFADNGVVKFTVQVSTGSDFVSSEEYSVAILEPPALIVNAPAELTAQPYEFSATCTEICDFVVIVSSQGATSQLPDGLKIQTNGDTIYSDVLVPVWTEANDMFATTVTLPEGLDFWDLGEYQLSVSAIDRNTGLKSEDVLVPFSVDWANKASDPAATVYPMETVDADGKRHIGAQIILAQPQGASSTDVYDIYRMDSGKAQLIGKGFPLAYTAYDEYAPYVEDDAYGQSATTFYRIALRTADGDISFDDFEYGLYSNSMRFDWSGGSLELPYGLSIGESYAKNVEFRDHLDGTTDGYWRQNINRKGSFGTSVIKLVQPDEIALARDLARYAGAVFVRLPNGSAYTADVQITDLSMQNKAVTTIAIDATEVELTPEFALPIPFTLEEE